MSEVAERLWSRWVLINHLLAERWFWAAYVGMTHDPGDYADAVGLAFGVDVDRAYDWYVDQAHGRHSQGVVDPARIVIPLQAGVSLQINDAGEDGIFYELVAGNRGESLGEFSGHSRLPLLRHREAVRLAEVCAAPPQAVGWRNAMATALVIGGSWDGPPSSESQREVSAMWSATGMVSDRSGADGLAGVWAEKVAWESQTSKGRGDPFGLENQHDVISGVRLSKLSPSDRLLARALGWAQP